MNASMLFNFYLPQRQPETAVTVKKPSVLPSVHGCRLGQPDIAHERLT